LWLYFLSLVVCGNTETQAEKGETMAEENQEQSGDELQQGAGTPEAGGEAGAAKADEVVISADHKALQAKFEELQRKSAEDAQLLEAVTPHVNWDAVRGGGQSAEADEGEGEEEFVSKKSLAQSLRQVGDIVNTKMAALKFRQDHPELLKYEDSLVGPAILRIRRENPSLSTDRVCEKAAEFATEFLASERDKGKGEAADKSKTVAATGGLASGGVTPSVKPKDDAGESDVDYIARRKAESAKRRGIA